MDCYCILKFIKNEPYDDVKTITKHSNDQISPMDCYALYLSPSMVESVNEEDFENLLKE